MLVGPRCGLAWTGAAFLGVWWTYFAGDAAGMGPSGFSGSHPVIRAINLSAMLSIFSAVSLTFVRQQDRAIRELRLASEAKSQFLAAMSHEIRTPLNGVLGMAQLLLETNQTGRQRELAETIRSSGVTLLTLLNEILDLSRIEAGRVEIAQVDFDLRELLGELERIVTGSAQEKGLTLSFSVAAELPEALKGDPDHLHQVLLNLVSNAIKFTDRGGVEVRAQARSRQGPDGILMVRFEVTDTGIGIPPEDVEHIFERFSQVDQSFARRHGGAGLGLAIAKGLAETMDGEIGVESRPGEGSRFWFSLPLLLGDPLAARSPKPAAETSPELPTIPLLPEPEAPAAAQVEGASAAARILLVEDNPVNQSVAVGMLEALGHRVDVADDGREGLRAASLSAYDVILMDCQMPVMDGFETTREIRRLEQSRPEPVHLPGDRSHCGGVRQGSRALSGSGHGRLPGEALRAEGARGRTRALASRKSARADRGVEAFSSRRARAGRERARSRPARRDPGPSDQGGRPSSRTRHPGLLRFGARARGRNRERGREEGRERARGRGAPPQVEQRVARRTAPVRALPRTRSDWPRGLHRGRVGLAG
jgi:signal transduction histidine kinase